MMSLGVFQQIWDAWNPLDAPIKTQTPDHFQTTILVQLLEVREALALGNSLHAAAEIVDIISVSLNWLRRLGLVEQDVAAVVKRRAKKYGDPIVILRYKDRYGI